ncbi:MAG: zinc-dependent metalloprotease [Aeriscardovia sp.]|nr:zinc-dependent metalloprotease [Aeriscardovia sp.]
MDSNELHQWMIDSFGPLQGEATWKQFEQLPDAIKNQLLQQSTDQLPDPQEMHNLVSSFADSGLTSLFSAATASTQGPINESLARSFAIRQAQSHSSSISELEKEQSLQALRTANLWLDSATAFDPVSGTADILTGAGWVEKTISSWIKLAEPVAQSTTQALRTVFSERFGGSDMQGEITGLFAGPVPIPLPDGTKDPAAIMNILGSTSFALQLGKASGHMASEVFGSFDQGLALSPNPSGALVPHNIEEFANDLKLPVEEVTAFIALREEAYARLYASAPWLMPQITVLINKYARGISIDLNAVEDQLRQAESMDPSEISGAVNLGKVGMQESEEQIQTKKRLEDMLALIEGWVDCVVWNAGAAFLPHLSQLCEMMRRRRVSGGPSEQTFANLIGLELRPRRAREAYDMWQKLTSNGIQDRDNHWSHPDLLPVFPDLQSASATTPEKSVSSAQAEETTDWDAALEQLLSEEDHGDENNPSTSLPNNK